MMRAAGGVASRSAVARGLRMRGGWIVLGRWQPAEKWRKYQARR